MGPADPRQGWDSSWDSWDSSWDSSWFQASQGERHLSPRLAEGAWAGAWVGEEVREGGEGFLAPRRLSRELRGSRVVLVVDWYFGTELLMGLGLAQGEVCLGLGEVC